MTSFPNLDLVLQASCQCSNCGSVGGLNWELSDTDYGLYDVLCDDCETLFKVADMYADVLVCHPLNIPKYEAKLAKTGASPSSIMNSKAQLLDWLTGVTVDFRLTRYTAVGSGLVREGQMLDHNTARIKVTAGLVGSGMKARVRLDVWKGLVRHTFIGDRTNAAVFLYSLLRVGDHAQD